MAKPVKKAKQKPLIVNMKPDDPARKFMSKTDALEANRKSRERKAKLDDYKQQLEAEDAAPSAPTAPEAPPEAPKKRGRAKKTEKTEE